MFKGFGRCRTVALLRTDPEDAGILAAFFFPMWCLLVVLGLLIGRRAGLRVTGGKRAVQR